MPRLPIITDEEATGEIERIFEGTKDLLGFISNSTRTFAYSPWITKWWIALIVAVNRDIGSVLDSTIRKLAVLKTSMLNDCEY